MKALVAYGTRYGSTTGIAEKIQEVLSDNGSHADLINLGEEKVKQIGDYDLIIIGSGIQVGSWTKETLRFFEENKNELKTKKVAMFATSGLARDKSKTEELRGLYLDQVAQKYGLTPLSTALFVGAIDMNKYSFPVKLLMKTMTKDLADEGYDFKKPIDLRDWGGIEEWAKKLAVETQ